MPITAQDNPPGSSIYAYTPGRGYSWAKIIGRMDSSDLFSQRVAMTTTTNADACSNVRRLHTLREDGLWRSLVMPISDPGHRPKPMPSLGLLK